MCVRKRDRERQREREKTFKYIYNMNFDFNKPIQAYFELGRTTFNYHTVDIHYSLKLMYCPKAVELAIHNDTAPCGKFNKEHKNIRHSAINNADE